MRTGGQVMGDRPREVHSTANVRQEVVERAWTQTAISAAQAIQARPFQ